MSNNPFNTSFDTRPSWERGTTQDFINAGNATAWDLSQRSSQGGYGGGYSGGGVASLRGRAMGFGATGLLLGLLVGALHGGAHHSLVSSTLIGLAGGAAIGAAFGVAWHGLMLVFGGVAWVLKLPVLRQALRGGVFGVLAGLAAAFFAGEAKDPAPVVAALTALGAGLGGVVGLIRLARRKATSAAASEDTTPAA